jgi:DNA-binding transcriptional LysR family regulator
MSAFSPLVRYFGEVADQKSIRRAAERLHIAPSAVTRQIAKFEELLGLPLFERLPRGVRLAAAGEVMLANVRRMQRDFEGALTQVDSLKVMRRGKVRIGILQYMSGRLIPDLISDVTRDHPGFSFTVRSANSVDIVDRIANGELDIGLCWAPPATAPVRHLRSVAVTLGVVVPAAHEWAKRRGIPLPECMSQPLIVPTSEMEQRRMLESLSRGAVMRLQPLAETNSIATMIQLVRSGAGAAVMTRVTVLDEILAGSLAPIPFTDRGLGQLSLELLVRADRNFSPPAELVLQLLETRFTKREPFLTLSP